MSGKQAKRARQAIRAAGGEDDVTRSRRESQQKLTLAERERAERKAVLDALTPAQRRANAKRAGMAVMELMAVIAAGVERRS